MLPCLPALVALALSQAAPPEPPAPPQAALEQPLPSPPAPEEAGGVPTRRYLIESIEFRGLEKTRPEAVRRHIFIEEGEILDPQRVLLSRLGLLQLGWFSSVEPRVERGSERGKVKVVFEVVERNTLVVTDLIFGSTKPQPLYGGLALSEQNFAGQGLGLSGGALYGGSPDGRSTDSRYSLRAGFYAPDLRVKDLRLVLGFQVISIQGDELTCSDVKCSQFVGNYVNAPRAHYSRQGGDFQFGIRPGPFERLTGTYTLEKLHATLDNGLAPGVGPYILVGSSTLAGITGSYEVETRDDFFYPTDGFRAIGQVTFASKLVGSDYEFSRYLLQAETAYELFRIPLRLQTALGAVQGNAPFFDRFYGADYSYFAIGPALGRAMELNFSTDSRYDAFLFMGGLEYAIPLWTGGAAPFHRAYVALGARYVWSSATLGGGRTTFSTIPFSFDVALRLDTVIGSFNLSLGYALDNAL